ncbi:hypothetical protein E0494_10555 [Marinilabiliaceae bacterium JC040]|nr:hypothetical protein [Marinilabiliaceae bacterium JC040]
MKKLQITLAILLISMVGLCQDVEQKQPKGKIYGTIFSNFHYLFGDENHYEGFELKRAYLGYKYQFDNNFSAKILLDAGNPGEDSKYEYTVFVKNAFLKWSKNDISLRFGIFTTNSFIEQQRLWNHRYVYQVFVTQYHFDNSADLGISFDYKFSKNFSFDASITNGEGYKKIQKNDKYKYSLGFSYKNKGFIARLYADISTKNDYDFKNEDILVRKEDPNEDQQSVLFFLGYKSEKFSVGGEYNNLSNFNFRRGENVDGYSIYSTYNFTKKQHIYGRFDNLSDSENNSLTTLILGYEISPISHIRISPNIRIVEDLNFFYLNLKIQF